jgi:hypothetical protein|tara:strand:- start:705 stop:881 length:177 start_codon:yes stop_codon:yes gene_type:complete
MSEELLEEFEHIMNMDKEIEVICPEHGSFFVTPNNHLGYNKEKIAYGCPNCDKDILLN